MTDAIDLFTLCSVHSRGTRIYRFILELIKRGKRGFRLVPGLMRLVWILFDYTFMCKCVTHEECAKKPK
jgi:hypothetical protein